MSSIVSQLLLKISSDTAELLKGLNDTKDKVNDFEKGIEKMKEMLIEAFAVKELIEYAAKLVELAEKISENTEKVEHFSELSGKALDQVSGKIQAASDVFGGDFNANLNAANVLVKQSGASWEEATTLIAQGSALNRTQSEAFLNLINQYTPTFKAMGYSASESVALISQSLQKGLGDDMGTALLKFHTNLETLSPAVRKALEGIGLNVDDLVLRVREGSLSEKDALTIVTTQMQQFGNTSGEVANVVGELFGKAGKKIGAEMIESLGGVKKTMQELIDESGEGVKAQLRLVDATSEWDTVMTSLFKNSSGLFADLKADMIYVAVDVLTWMINNTVSFTNAIIDAYNNSLLFRTLIQQTVFIFKEMWEAIKLVGNILIDVFSSAGRLIKDVFTLNLKDIPNAYKDAFTAVAKDAVDYGKNTYQNFKDAFDASVNNKPLKLINLDEVKKQGEDAGKEFQKGLASSMGGDSSGGKSKTTKSKDDKNPFGIDLAIFSKAEDGLTKIKTHIDGVTKSAFAFRTEIQKLGDNFAENIQQKAYPAAQQLGTQLGTMAASGKASFADLGNAALSTAKNIIAAALSQSLASTIAANADLPYPADVIAITLGTAAITSAFAAIPSFSDGVSNFGGGLAMINENNRGEIVNLPNGSNVIPHDLSKNILNNSGSGSNLHLTLESQIKGEDLRFVLKRVEQRRGNSSY